MIVLPIPDAKEIERSGISSYNGSGIIGWVSLLDIGEGKFGIQLQLTNPNETTLIRGQDLDNTWRLYQAIRHDKMIAGFISQQYGGQDVPLSRIAFENSDSQSFRDIPTLYDVHGPEADMFVEKNPKYVEAFTRRITIHPSIDDYHRAIINQIEVRRYYMGIKEQMEIPWEEAYQDWHGRYAERFKKVHAVLPQDYQSQLGIIPEESFIGSIKHCKDDGYLWRGDYIDQIFFVGWHLPPQLDNYPISSGQCNDCKTQKDNNILPLPLEKRIAMEIERQQLSLVS